MIVDYDEFIAHLNEHRLGHCARMIVNSGCRIIVAVDADVASEMDHEYNIWCRENSLDKYFVYNENYVFFDTEEDAIAFKLMWS